jgi:NAD(P)H-hydrate repair Nnr-like enzyme with NAD(P)H-hydrate dehydratase domain
LPEDFAGFPPARAAAAHKGSYGRLAIIAGSLGYHGAAVLASRGPQTAQPGLITLHTLEAVYPAVTSQLQAVMVWDFAIGSYQVMKKWLSYREHDLLGRPLTPDEAREVTHMARRLAALLLLAPALDANYAAAKASTTPLPQL